jgi:catechol 2,3-dioxygenase
MHDTPGSAERPQPATPGSYGDPPRGYRLPDGTRAGAVRLQVADLARSLSFYRQVLGLRVVQHDAARAALAATEDDTPLVHLHQHPGAAPARRGQLGLYHFAILLPDRRSLGRFVRHLAELGVAAGAGDHLVSEAFYLSDPDGLGIEVYADRPRDSWQRIGRELMLATEPVDVDALVQLAGSEPWTGMPAGTTIGHVHLHVGALQQASDFYSEALGLDRMTWRYPGALFMGAGGYHHHLGTNTWAGAGARPPGDGDARLLEWSLEVPGTDDVRQVARSLGAAGVPMAQASDGSITAQDPWGTNVRIRTRSTHDSTAPHQP